MATLVAAGVTSLAYLNAKYALGNDLRALLNVKKITDTLTAYEKADRLNFFYRVEEHARQIPDQPALHFQGQEWTYGELYTTVLRYAAWLKQTHNVQKGEIVAMDFPNCPQFVFLWLAIWSLGAMPAFINYNLTGKPLVHVVKTASARLFIVDEGIYQEIPLETREALNDPAFRGEKGALTTVVLDTPTETDVLSRAPFRAPSADRKGQTIPGMCLLIYTSGTTGLPKAAVMTWRKAYTGVGISVMISATRQDVMYSAMPMYHSAASMMIFSAAIITGCKFVLGKKFSVSNFWSEVRATNVTFFNYVGETLRYLLTAPQSPRDQEHKVRVVMGNGLRPDIFEEFRDRFGIPDILEFFAATEAPAAFMNLSKNRFTTGAVGRTGALLSKLLSGTQALVQLDPATDAPWRDPQTGFCNRVGGQGEPGEMLYKLDPENPSEAFQGYFNNTSATEGKVLRDVFVKGDMWYRTGDLLRHDEEGRWFFSDRIGDTFRWKGENVSTNEVGDIVGSHPAVELANVYGVSLPRHDGRAGCAALVLDKGATATPTTMKSLAETLGKQLPRYAVPVFLRVVESMEITGNNKLQKTALRNEGVDMGVVRDAVFWLREGSYVPFTKSDWEAIERGEIKL